MEDLRCKVIDKVKIELNKKLVSKDIDIVTDVLTAVLKDYEVTKTCTELSTDLDCSEMALKDCAASLLVAGRSELTVKQYIREFHKLLDCVNKPINMIQPYDVKRYLMEARKRGCSDRSQENSRANISAVFTWLEENDYVEKSPMNKIDKIKYQKKVKKPFTDCDLDLLKEKATNKRDRAIIELLSTSGMRISELIGLKREDVDFGKNEMIVLGKGNAQRVCYMTPVAAMHLKNYLDERKDDDPSLFVGQRGAMTASGVRNMLKGVEADSCVQNVHPHRFRRTFATNQIVHGNNLENVRIMMGHSDISTTQIYMSIDQRQVKESYGKYS